MTSISSIKPGVTCIKCHRDLTLEVSINRGMGAVCAARVAEAAIGRGAAADVMLPFDPVTKDIICSRDDNNQVGFNIYPAIVHHSPSGFEWGYGGSGPADFALNILEHFMRERGEAATMLLGKQKICPMSWRLHQDFKWEHIATLPREGGIIKGDTIRKWIEHHA